MPDNPRNFDDDLTPDWLRNFDSPRGQNQPPQDRSGAGQSYNAPPPRAGSAPPPRAGSSPRGTALAPWDRMPGSKAPVPPPPGHTPAPWIQLQGPDAPPPDRAVVPWAEGPGGGTPEEQAPPAFSPRSGGGQSSEVPRGLTGALPWMSDQQPSKPVQPPAEDAAWLSGFGEAANFDMSAPTSDETDLGWLRSEAQQSAPPAQPRSALDWLNDAAPPPSGEPAAESELPPWLEDEEAFGDQPDAAAPPAAHAEDALGLDWLRAETEQAAEPAVESELPPWLGDEDIIEDQPDTSAPPAQPRSALDWLRAEAEQAAEPAAAASEDEWSAAEMFDLGTGQETPAAQEEAPLDVKQRRAVYEKRAGRRGRG